MVRPTSQTPAPRKYDGEWFLSGRAVAEIPVQQVFSRQGVEVDELTQGRQPISDHW